MNKTFFHLAIMAILLGSQVVFGQSVSSNPTGGSPSSTNNQLMPLTEVREGMQGTARSVFRGTEPEEFNVEILGVIPGAVGPKQDLIIGRLSGGPADRTGVFAGMSGSPVYVNGKLVGAISYSFPFSKEPICGITPIEQIVSIFEQKRPAKTAISEPRSFSFREIVSSSTTDLSGYAVQDSARASGMSPNSML